MVPEAEADELELRDYLRVLMRRKGTIVLATLLVVAAALVASFLQTPIYQAEAEVLVEQAAPTQLFDPTTGQRLDAERQLQNEIQFLKSRTVRDSAEEELAFEPDVSIGTVERADLLEVKARSTEPEQAALAANTYARVYIELRRERAVNEYLESQRVVQEKIDELQAEVAQLEAPVIAIDEELRTNPPESRREELEAARAATEASITPPRNELRRQQDFYRERLNQIDVVADLLRGQGAQVISEADVPTTPIRPTPLRNGIVALVVGLVFGVGLAFLFEYLDDTVKSKDDLERVAPGATVLAMIPAVQGWRDRKDSRLISLSEPTSPAAEAYRSLRTSVQFMSLDQPLRIIQMTSPIASEGKTTTLSNLAVVLARAGQRVVVVCCDLRRPRVHEFFGLSNAVGFTSVLLGDCPLDAAVQRVPGEERLFLLASGPPPPNPSELLSSQRARDVLNALKAEADVVLVDCPPVLPVTDALVLAGAVDGTILVASAGSTRKTEAHRAVELLQQVDAPLLGAVLNNVTSAAGYGYGYGYGYGSYYGPAPDANGEKGKRRRRGRHARADVPVPEEEPATR